MTNSCKLDHSIFDERQNNYYESSNKLQTPNNDKKSAKLRSCDYAAVAQTKQIYLSGPISTFDSFRILLETHF